MQATFFDAQRMGISDSVELTARSLQAHGVRHRHWAIAYSGGKDSTTLLTVVMHLLKTGAVERPERLTVCYADTRMELPPLAASASRMLGTLRAEGVEVRVALPPMDERFFVYMLGRGVPPPTNHFRWCTGQIKVEPMEAALREMYAGEKILMLTGVRQGESAARDGRIAMSCGKDGAECGQGWYQETLPDHLCDTLAPILHWRTCLVWDWLTGAMPAELRHGYETRLVAEAYGLDEEGSVAEKNARTGCNGCPLASQDAALDNLLKSPRWGYLRPLKKLRPLYRWLREPTQRLRKPGFERSKAGVVRHTNRMGPLTMDARRTALREVLAIQARVNEYAGDMPAVDMLDELEVARIEELIEAGTWPNRWTGDEPTGDQPFERVHRDGSLQREMFGG
ncbi:phosphoadenosine phosphosulfate reductase domain-containing protein [Paludisphaera soli]|uniref:phosphoadenosine phosphosulfate reductase domain-containing protein n=1 Tax=Paludisphaera soli TaxID=2712865 RepID=UPI0013EADB9F|nr:phosphoadenosine phosphosulfate reductase family protein [Paludisphaera soli]